jgi:hypothetical protein
MDGAWTACVSIDGSGVNPGVGFNDRIQVALGLAPGAAYRSGRSNYTHTRTSICNSGLSWFPTLQETVHIGLSQNCYPPPKTKLHLNDASVRHGSKHEEVFEGQKSFGIEDRAEERSRKHVFERRSPDRLSKACFVRMTPELANLRLRFVLRRFGRSF